MPKDVLRFAADLCEEIPQYDHFFSIEELHEKSNDLQTTYPDRVRTRQIGKTALGTSIELTEIGDLSQNSESSTLLLKGIVHPNEAISTLTTTFLAEQFAASPETLNDLGYDKALIIDAADPDGYAMQGWLNQGLSAKSYIKGFYRPPGNQQVDAGYPYSYKQLECEALPESLAVAEVIKKYPPDFMAALHNSAIGKPYLYIDQLPHPAAPAITQWFRHNNLLPATDSIESPFANQWAPGLYEPWTIEQRYDHLEISGKNPLDYFLNGASSRHFLAQINPDATHLATELPYFRYEGLYDESPADIYIEEAVADGLKRRLATVALIKENLDALSTDGSVAEHPLFKATAFQYGLMSNYLRLGSTNKQGKTKATRGQVVSSMYKDTFYSLTQLGQLNRLAELSGRDTIAAELNSAIDTGLKEMEDAGGKVEPIPLRELAIAQTGFVLIAAGLKK